MTRVMVRDSIIKVGATYKSVMLSLASTGLCLVVEGFFLYMIGWAVSFGLVHQNAFTLCSEFGFAESRQLLSGSEKDHHVDKETCCFSYLYFASLISCLLVLDNFICCSILFVFGIIIIK